MAQRPERDTAVDGVGIDHVFPSRGNSQHSRGECPLSPDVTTLTVEDYRVLFDRPDFPSSSASCVVREGRLWMAFQMASDTDAGLNTHLTTSDDLGRTWTNPVPFGPPVADLETDFQGANLAHVARDGTFIASGIRIPGLERDSGEQWRPSEIFIGRESAMGKDFEWTHNPSGTFLAEQFVAPESVQVARWQGRARTRPEAPFVVAEDRAAALTPAAGEWGVRSSEFGNRPG
jgi:hypothetical protein